jgi:hypothetical protein
MRLYIYIYIYIYTYTPCCVMLWAYFFNTNVLSYLCIFKLTFDIEIEHSFKNLDNLRTKSHNIKIWHLDNISVFYVTKRVITTLKCSCNPKWDATFYYDEMEGQYKCNVAPNITHCPIQGLKPKNIPSCQYSLSLKSSIIVWWLRGGLHYGPWSRPT